MVNKKQAYASRFLRDAWWADEVVDLLYDKGSFSLHPLAFCDGLEGSVCA